MERQDKTWKMLGLSLVICLTILLTTWSTFTRQTREADAYMASRRVQPIGSVYVWSEIGQGIWPIDPEDAAPAIQGCIDANARDDGRIKADKFLLYNLVNKNTCYLPSGTFTVRESIWIQKMDHGFMLQGSQDGRTMLQDMTHQVVAFQIPLESSHVTIEHLSFRDFLLVVNMYDRTQLTKTGKQSAAASNLTLKDFRWEYGDLNEWYRQMYPDVDPAQLPRMLQI